MLSYRYMPSGSIPFDSKITSYINDPDVNISGIQLGGYAITPEIRLYAHKNMKGFYVAPYARIANFDMTIPIKYSTTINGQQVKKDANFTGNMKSFSGGIMIGTQHQLFKKLVLDIWIIGGHYGSSNGDFLGGYNSDPNPAIAAQERQSLQTTIANNDIGPFNIKGQLGPTAAPGATQTATFASTGPWAGLRGAGLTLGFRF